MSVNAQPIVFHVNNAVQSDNSLSIYCLIKWPDHLDNILII